MGNSIISKEKWIQESLDTIKLKFDYKELKSDDGDIIDWNTLSYYLDLLYDYKYNNKKYLEKDFINCKINPLDLDCFI